MPEFSRRADENDSPFSRMRGVSGQLFATGGWTDMTDCGKVARPTESVFHPVRARHELRSSTGSV
jgi:hypothetical protein